MKLLGVITCDNLQIIILMLALFATCGNCVRRNDDDDDDYADLIMKEIEKGEDESSRTNTKSVKSGSEGNENGKQAKKEIREAIATLKKYAEWKGKWDFIKSSQQVVREAKELVQNEGYTPMVLEYSESANSVSCGNLTSVGVKIIVNAIRSSSDHDEIAAEISRQMNDKFDKYWHCLVNDGKHYAHQMWHDSYIIVHVGELRITLFHSSQVTSFDAILNARRRIKSKRQVKILTKSMSRSMSDKAIENAIDVVQKSDDLGEISGSITKYMSETYGDQWQAIVGPKNEKCFSFDINHDLMVQFALDDIEFTLFNSTKRTARDMIIEARTKTASTTRSSMDPFMKKEIILIASEGLSLFDDQTAIADHITEKLNHKYGKLWFAVLSFGPSDFGLDKSTMEQTVKSDSNQDGKMITFAIGEVRFHIYKVYRETNEENIISQARKSIPRILNNQMPSSMKSDALQVAIEAIRTSNYLLSIAGKIQRHFEEKYSNTQWQVIVNLRNNDVHANLRYLPRSFLHFGIGEIVVRIFKSSSSSSKPSKGETTTTSEVKQMSQLGVINKAKSSTPKVIAVNDLEQLKTHALNITTNAFAKNKDFKAIASEIKKNFAETFELLSHFIYGFNWLPELYWNCLVGTKDQFTIGQFLITQQRYIIIEMDLVQVIIFQTGGFQCDEMLNYSKGSKVIQRQHWVSGEAITREMYRETQMIAVDAMKSAKNCIVLSEMITSKMQDKWKQFKNRITALVGISNSFQYSCETNLMKFYIGYLSFRICL